MHRLYSQRDLQLDVNLLTSSFPRALADALDRTLAWCTGYSVTRARRSTARSSGGIIRCEADTIFLQYTNL